MKSDGTIIPLNGMASVPSAKSGMHDLNLPRWFWLLPLLWTTLVGISLWWNLRHIQQTILDLALVSARSHLDNDSAIRQWAIMHDGVYVPANPYRTNAPEGDMTLESGRRPILTNSVSTSRQLCAINTNLLIYHGHLTSLVPLRPQNAPDDWEQNALKQLEKGVKEVTSVEQLDGEPHLRIMRPMPMNESCIECHSGVTSTNNSILGGASVAVALKDYESVVNPRKNAELVGHLVFGLAGLSFIGLGGWQIGLRRSEQMRAQNSIFESEKRYRLIFTANPAPMWIYDPLTLRFLEVNEAAIKHYGYSSEEFLSMTLRDIRPAEDVPALEARMRSIPDGLTTGTEWRHRKKDGSVIDVCIISHNIELQERSARLVLAQDITERKRAEARIQERNRYIETILENAPIGFAVHTIDEGNAVFVSSKFEEIYGVPRNSLHSSLDAYFEKVFPDPRYRAVIRSQMLSDIGAKDPLKMRWENIPIRTSQGEQKFVTAVNIPLLDQNLLVSTVQDMTARHLSEIAHKESEARFRTLVDATFEGIALTEHGVFVDMNERITEMLGYSREELIGKPLLKVAAPESHDFLAEAIRNCPPEPYEHVALRRDGTRILVEVRARSVEIGGRKLRFSSVRDITEQKKAEKAKLEMQAQLIQAQKMEAVGHLAGGVAHDFNNILTAVMMQLSALQDLERSSPEIEDAVNELMEEADRAANLVRQLLMYSRRSVLEIKPINLNEVVSHLLKMLRRLLGEHIILKFHADASLPNVDADAGMMEQVLMNLCVNARDAMPHGGKIDISTDLVCFKADDIQENPNRQEGRWVCLGVTDTGCGMNEQVVKHIFEPFFTTKEVGKGTGLGLATVFGIVKQHHGWIEVQSAIGTGSAFRVFLPASTCAANDKLEAPSRLIAMGHETILLVEDETKVRQCIAQTLKVLGYRVLEVKDGREALECWKQHRSEIDLLFTDVIMPNGILGIDLAQQLRSEKPTLKILISTGYSEEITGNLAINDYHLLRKPYKTPLLGKAVRECLDLKSS